MQIALLQVGKIGALPDAAVLVAFGDPDQQKGQPAYQSMVADAILRAAIKRTQIQGAFQGPERYFNFHGYWGTVVTAAITALLQQNQIIPI